MTDDAERLYGIVGRIVVAGGQIEWHLHQLVHRLGGPRMATNWKRLSDTALRLAVQHNHVRRREIVDLVENARAERLVELRDVVVHSCWQFQEGRVLRAVKVNRAARGSSDEDSPVVILPDLDYLERLADDLHQYSDRLRVLVADSGWG
jgi:hypothetical protein